GRRRETAIMASMTTAYTLRQLQCSYVDSLKDMTNAFPSVSWKRMELAAESLVRDRDYASHFNAFDERRCFYQPLKPWSLQWQAEDDADKKLKVKCPITNLIADMSLHIYADDINAKILQRPPAEKENVSLDKLRHKLLYCDKILSDNLSNIGLAQNTGNQVNLMACRGLGSGIARRDLRLREQRQKWPGQLVDQARYLGPIITSIQSFGIELAKRVQAAKAAFYSMGSFWSAPRIPWRWKRTVLLGRVDNSAFSSVEAFLPTERQCGTLDAAIASLARVALRGRACTWNEDGTVRSLTNAEVLAYWKIARAEVALRVRRLKWPQQAAKDRNGNAQLSAAMFGTISGQALQTVSDDGALSSQANPWAKRAQEDVNQLINCSVEAQSLLETAGPQEAAVDAEKAKADELVAAAKGPAGKGASKAQVAQQLVLLLSKLVLSMAGDLRSVISAVFATARAPLAMPAAAAAAQAGKDYQKAATKLRGDHKEDEAVDTAQLESPRIHEGLARSTLATYWKDYIVKKDMFEAAEGARYFRARAPQGKETGKKSKRMEGKARLQWALSTNKVAQGLGTILRGEVARQGGEITIGAAPRGVLERGARARLNKLEDV
ncbi:unnamed protein product, partial [Prorocentrum cordatum]